MTPPEDNPMSNTTPATVAEGLTKAQREALMQFDGNWTAGPSLPDEVLSEIKDLREADLIERQFLDEGPPVHSVGEYQLSVKLSACWHFRLTPFGEQVCAHIRENHRG